jgi:hypothetical protein
VRVVVTTGKQSQLPGLAWEFDKDHTVFETIDVDLKMTGSAEQINMKKNLRELSQPQERFSPKFRKN